MHPSDDIVGQSSQILANKRIVLGMSGSVAILKAVELARLLMRHGARIYPVMSRGAQQLVGVDLVHWATGERPITRLTGGIEHVQLAGNVPQPVDLVLVAPATANTVGKIACGIDDTPVTTFVTTAWGQGIPIMIVPAMHQSMYEHPLVMENLNKLRQLGLHVVLPRLEEGKAKIPEPSELVEEVIRLLVKKPVWENKRVVITVGRTEEPLDAVRLITNPSSGKMGMALAREAFRRGAVVDLILGEASVPPPHGVRRILRCRTTDDMVQAAEELLKEPCSLIIAAAAVGDWKSRQSAQEKVPTTGRPVWSVDLIPTVKVVDRMRQLAPASILVQFRALVGAEPEAARIDALDRLKSGKADFIAFNDVGQPGQGFGSDENRVILFDRDGGKVDTGLCTKQEVAIKILDEIEKNI